tara:strand:- start:46402 stop:46587 length:186 start_codon:yes stop_codon:yes gene_type:complete
VVIENKQLKRKKNGFILIFEYVDTVKDRKYRLTKKFNVFQGHHCSKSVFLKIIFAHISPVF